MDAQHDINREHSERIAKLEVGMLRIVEDLDRVVREVVSIKRAIWFVGCAVLASAGPNLEKTLKVLVSIVG